MSCKWKPENSAQCACAYQLTANAKQIVREFSALGQTTLTLREPGLSLSKCSSPTGGNESTHVPLFKRGSTIYLLHDSETSKPALSVALPGKPASCTLRLNDIEWHSAALKKFLSASSPKPVGCPDARNLRAGFWMDDFGSRHEEDIDHLLAKEACQTIRRCRHLEIHLQAETCNIRTSCKPTFVDSERNIIRIADRACRNVVYADTADPDFRLHHIGKDELHLTRHKAPVARKVTSLRLRFQ